jgi:hypothetical protein
MILAGLPIDLAEYPAEVVTNPQFAATVPAALDACYLPLAVQPLLPEAPRAIRRFIEDDNRGAILPAAVATLDGQPFYLSIKGVGAAVAPYSWRALDRGYAAELAHDPLVRARLGSSPPEGTDRTITGELWLRGSPYGGQGWEHAATALGISERADLTSIRGFLIAPVVQIARLPPALEEQLRSIYWYRQYRGRFVQEIRLVPSNVRIYFHARNTVGNNVRHVFDLFRVDSNERALVFETNFLRTTVAMLTLFARTMERASGPDEFRGLDFHDVWLDKDAVVAPNGSVYFVDLEGIDEVAVAREGVREKIEDQVYRSLYELTFAYEQIEAERIRRFGDAGGAAEHFEGLLRAALQDDPIVRLRAVGRGLEFEIRNNCQEPSLYTRFQAVDR